MELGSSNFAFLRPHDIQLVRLGALAERYFHDDPNTCLIKLRQFGELLAQLIAGKTGLLQPGEESQADLLRRLKFERLLPSQVADVPLQEFAVAQTVNPYQSTRLLLDGQQRLTSLSAVIRGEPVTVRGRKRPIELLFNLEHPDHLVVVTEVNEDGAEEDEADGDEELGDEADSSDDELQRRFNQMTFVVATKKLEQLPHWVKVSEVFKADSDAPFLKRAGMTGFDDPRYEKYSQRLARLRGICKYVYRMDVLERTLSYDEVTEIFVRVNSLGAKLRSSDLALAQITAKWRHSLETFQKFQADCAKAGFDLELGVHLRNLIAFATGQSRFRTVGSLSADALKQAWKEACEGMQFAINFLKSNVGIESPALLSSPFLMVVIAYFGHARGYKISTEESAQLRYWALIANAKGRYSRGSSETLVDQDLASLRDGGTIQDLVDRLRLQVGRLDITADELEGRNQRSALFKTMFLASAPATPRTGAQISRYRSIIPAVTTDCSSITSSRRRSSRAASHRARPTTSRTWRS
jgi:hypothetical protein